MSEIKKILVVRNDKIGDFVLALPAIQIIKKAFPNATITALVPRYTKDIAESFVWIDDVIIDDKDPQKKKALAHKLRAQSFDGVICLFSDTYNATLVRHAKIPVRVAPATKWVQFLYTHTLSQRRSKSVKPEFEYNLDLAQYFIKVLGGVPQTNDLPCLAISEEVKNLQQEKLTRSIGMNFSRKRCFIHPVTGGSSNTLLPEQWLALVQQLQTLDDFQFVITAGPGEEAKSKQVYDLLVDRVKDVIFYAKNDGVRDFIHSISLADMFVAGSTGPLHIAGALDVPTIGFYPQKRSSTALRWKTLNSEGKWLALSPTEQEADLERVDICNREHEIASWYIAKSVVV